MKIVINSCFGGFGLSAIAVQKYAAYAGLNLKRKKTKWGNRGYEIDGKDWYFGDINRDDIALVKVVEELGNDASDALSSLKVVDIPNDVEWQIGEYDGKEWVAEKHRTWS